MRTHITTRFRTVRNKCGQIAIQSTKRALSQHMWEVGLGTIYNIISWVPVHLARGDFARSVIFP